MRRYECLQPLSLKTANASGFRCAAFAKHFIALWPQFDESQFQEPLILAFFLWVPNMQLIMNDAMSDDQQTDLFKRYVDICNRAMEANKDRFPFKQILGAAQNQASPAKNIEVCIIDDRPDAAYVLHFDHDKMSGAAHDSCPNCQCDKQWRITRSYLEDVIKNPDEYIDNPAKINWDWMMDDNKPV